MSNTFDLNLFLKSKGVTETKPLQTVNSLSVFRTITGIKDFNNKSILFTCNNYIEAIARTMSANEDIEFNLLVNISINDTEVLSEEREKYEYTNELINKGFGNLEMNYESIGSLADMMKELEKELRAEAKANKIELVVSYNLVGLDKDNPINVENANAYLDALR